MSELVIGGRTFRSRLFVGTGKFSSNELMARAIAASESEMVTVAMKRIDMNNPQDDMLAHVRRPEIQLLPNTSGVRDAEEAVLAAQLAREAFGTNFIKLEIHPDPKYLLPDPVETLKATEQLAKMGFVHPGRPGALQAARRGGRRDRNAAGGTDRHQQGTGYARPAGHHHRTEQRPGHRGRRAGRPVPRGGSNGDGC